MNWKFVDVTNRVAIRTLESGQIESMLAEALPDGVVPEPADPAPAPSPLEQIRALEAQYADEQARMTRQSLLAIALDKACADPAAENLSRDQVHTMLMSGDNGYAALCNLEQQVAALRNPA